MEASITNRLIEIMDENQILKETNANLQTQIENIQEEIQILTGDLRSSADALDALE